MTRHELIVLLAERLDKTQIETSLFVTELLAVIQDTLAEGDKLTLVGFGVFDTAYRPARKGRNPLTGEPIDIAAKYSATFSPGKALQAAVQRRLQPVVETPSAPNQLHRAE